MVSEDSDEFVSGFSPVHGRHDLGHLHQTRSGQMVTVGHELDAVRELLEVVPLGRPQRMPPEERNDRLQQIHAAAHGVAV